MVLNQKGYYLEKTIVKLIIKYVGKALFLKIKDLGSIFGSWLVGYKKKCNQKTKKIKIIPEKSQTEHDSLLLDPKLNSSLCYNYSISQSNPFSKQSLNNSFNPFCNNKLNFFKKKSKIRNQCEEIPISNHGSHIHKNDLIRLIRGFTYKGSTNEMIEVFQIFKKRNNMLIRERLETILDLDEYINSNSANFGIYQSQVSDKLNKSKKNPHFKNLGKIHLFKYIFL